jgi:hypothetical protein
MSAVQSLQHGHRALRITLASMVVLAAMVVSGLVGYLAKGSTTLITPTRVTAPAPVNAAQAQPHPNPDTLDAAQAQPHPNPDTLDAAATR